MKRKRFSVEQIVAVVKQAELGASVADVIRKVGITEETFYRWITFIFRPKFGFKKSR